MSISLEPSTQLGFNRPLTQLVKKSLFVRNHNAQPVAFKVKTTAPKLYCVRPNSGRIEPGQTVEVQVLLQPMKEEPPLSIKCKDKFLVQSMFISPENETKNLTDIWGSSTTDLVHQQKIKVVYLSGDETIGEETQDSMMRNTSSFVVPDDNYGTAHHTPSHNRPRVEETFMPTNRGGAHTPTPERTHSPAGGEYIIAHEETTQHETHYGDSPSEERPSAAERKYAEAQAEIARLERLVTTLQDSGMRRRARVMSDDGTESTFTGDGESVGGGETVVDGGHQAEGGVPLQVVLIIALGVFTLTYLFF